MFANFLAANGAIAIAVEEIQETIGLPLGQGKVLGKECPQLCSSLVGTIWVSAFCDTCFMSS